MGPRLFHALVLSACLFASFVFGHALVLAFFRAQEPRERRQALRLTSWRHAVGFVGAEALMLTLVLSAGLVRLAPFSLAKSALTLAAGIAWWELQFYFCHRLLHTRLLFRFHRSHHEETRVHPSLTFSAVETVLLSSGFYLPLALASHAFQAVSIPTLVAVLGGAYVLNVLSHLEGERLSDHVEASFVRHVLNAPRYHARHHSGASGNFGLNAPWFDRLFRTELGHSARER